MKNESRVYIVDDDMAVREGLQMLFESAGHNVSTFANANSFLENYDSKIPCCLILDIHMPNINGLELQKMLAQQDAPPPIIFLTGHGSVSRAVRALKNGAVEFFQKPVIDENQLLTRVAEIIQQDINTRAEAARRSEIRKRIEKLTPRETEIMELIYKGKSNKIIAIDLGISKRTVELHRTHVMKKIDVRSVTELIRLLDNLKYS